jgi:phosphopantetheinyl transferase
MKAELIKVWKNIKIYLVKNSDVDKAGDFLMSKFVSKNKQEITENSYGKPFLKSNKFWFNLTHTVGYSALAISEENEVGIDIERLDRKVDFRSLIMSRFNIQLYCQLNSQKEFIKHWTIRESAIKCYGDMTLNSIYSIKTNDELDLLKCDGKEDLEYHTFFYDELCVCVCRKI